MSDYSVITRIIQHDMKNTNEYPWLPLHHLKNFVYSTWAKPPKHLDVLSYYVHRLHIELLLCVVEGTYELRTPLKSSVRNPLTKNHLSPHDQFEFWFKSSHDIRERLKSIIGSYTKHHKIDWEARLTMPPQQNDMQRKALQENKHELHNLDNELKHTWGNFVMQLKAISGQFRQDLEPMMKQSYGQLMFMIEQTKSIQDRIKTVDKQEALKDLDDKLKELTVLQKKLRELEDHQDPYQKDILAFMHAVEKEDHKKTEDCQKKLKEKIGKKHVLHKPFTVLIKNMNNRDIVWDHFLNWRQDQLRPHAEREHLYNSIHTKQKEQSDLHKKVDFYTAMRKEYLAQYTLVHDQWESWFQHTVKLVKTSQVELQKSYLLLSQDFKAEEVIWKHDRDKAFLQLLKSTPIQNRQALQDQFDFIIQKSLATPLSHKMEEWHTMFNHTNGNVWELTESVECAHASILLWFYLIKIEFIMMLWV